METEPDQRASDNPSVLSVEPHVVWARPLAIATAIVFFISSTFPVVAAFVKDRESWPKWWGVLDVSIAFVLAMLAFAVLASGHGRVTRQAEEVSYRVYRILIHGIFAAMLVFVLFGDWIVWSNCLTGIAWRAWLLLYSLPAWFALFGMRAVPAERSAAAIPHE